MILTLVNLIYTINLKVNQKIMKSEYAFFLFVFLILAVIFGPLLIIWSLNTLFPILAIPYTWQTWLSIMFVGGLFKGNVDWTKRN